MKSESGITMTSLIIYILVMIIVVGIVATITSFFYTNVNYMEENSQNAAEVTNFNLYFVEEVEKKNNAIAYISPDQKTISFTSGNTYTVQDNAIYLNNFRICKDIVQTQIQLGTENEKTVITVLITVGTNMEYTKTTQYVMSK